MRVKGNFTKGWSQNRMKMFYLASNLSPCKTDYQVQAHGINLTVYHDITE